MFIATTMHYFYLVAFFWLNVLFFDVCRQFVNKTVKMDDFTTPLKRHHSKHRFVSIGVVLITIQRGF